MNAKTPMSADPSHPNSRAQRLARIGVTEDEMSALEDIWDTEVFRLTADTRTAALCDYGYDALDSLDAIWHELDDASANLYMKHGFTPHQAFLLDTDRQASHNLWGPAVDPERVRALLTAPLHTDRLVAILTTATSPDEATALITTETQADPAAAESDPLARLRALPDINTGVCDCLDT